MSGVSEAVMTRQELRARLSRLPRVSLATLPTPLELCPRLSAAVGGPPIYMKRDDLTGLALGGNKTRKLEFLLGDALHHGADCVVTAASAQSNHCRQTAAGCAKLGLECHLVLAASVHNELQGNLLLDHLLGAHVRLVEHSDSFAVQAFADEVEASLRVGGKRPYRINLPTGEAAVLAGAAYLDAVIEMEEQVDRLPERPGTIIVPASTGGTNSAVVVAVKALGLPYRVVAISSRKSAEQTARDDAALANRIAKRFDIPTSLSADEILVKDIYVGEGYALPTHAALEALRLTARTEGILLDPVYSGKGMAGLIDLARRGELGQKPVVFLHTGGAPALFAYHRELAA